MKRINKWWYFILVLWVLTGIVFIGLNKNFSFINDSDTNLILGIIGVAISIMSLGIATMRNPKFKGTIHAWNVEKQVRDVNNKGSGVPLGRYNCIYFQINNYEKHPINNMVVNFRMPKRIYYPMRYNNADLSFRDSRDTIIATFENLRYMGNSNGDCKLDVPHYINFKEWESNKSRVIYVTVAGDNIEPSTKRLKFDKLEELKISNENQKVKLL